MKILTKELSIYYYKNMPLHTLDKEGVYYFFVKDICEILEIDDWIMFKARYDPFSKVEITYFEYDDLDVPIVDTYGAYCFTFMTTDKKAEKFKLWLKDELMVRMQHMTFLKTEIFNDGQAHYLH